MRGSRDPRPASAEFDCDPSAGHRPCLRSPAVRHDLAPFNRGPNISWSSITMGGNPSWAGAITALSRRCHGARPALDRQHESPDAGDPLRFPRDFSIHLYGAQHRASEATGCWSSSAVLFSKAPWRFLLPSTAQCESSSALLGQVSIRIALRRQPMNRSGASRP